MQTDALTEFYAVLETLAAKQGGPRKFANLKKKDIPNRGVYFFLEEGETRPDGNPRVVRIGTHAVSKAKGDGATLWERLNKHKSGSRRVSVFRELVGLALVSSKSVPPCDSWQIKGSLQTAADQLCAKLELIKESERQLEAIVSERLGQMRVIWIEISDAPSKDSRRAYVERNSIALLTSQSAKGSSENWLGQHSSDKLVKNSGLWNRNFVGRGYDSEFLTEFARLANC